MAAHGHAPAGVLTQFTLSVNAKIRPLSCRLFCDRIHLSTGPVRESVYINSLSDLLNVPAN